MIWAAMSSAGVGPLCFLKSIVNAAIYLEILEHFMLPSADKLYGDADFLFQEDLAPAHTAKGTKSWFNDHGVTVLDWPANSPDLNPIENLWCIVKRKMRDTRPNNADELKANCQRNLGFHTGPALRGPPHSDYPAPSLKMSVKIDFYLWNIMVYLKNTVAKWIGFLALIWCYYSKNLGQSVSQSRILIVTSDTQTSRASGSTKFRHYAALLTKLKVWWNNFLMFNRGLDYRS